MMLLSLLTTFLVPGFTGYITLRMLFRRQRLPAVLTMALAYGLGMGLLAQGMLVLGILGLPLRSDTIISLMAGFLLVVIFIDRMFLSVPGAAKPEPFQIFNGRKKLFSLSTILLTIFIVFSFHNIFFCALKVPVIGWDVRATHAFTAQIVFYEQSLEYHRNFPHYMYPLQVPFLFAWIAMNIGTFDYFMIKIFSPMYLLAFCLVQFVFFRQYLSRAVSLAGVAMLLTANYLVLYASLGYREVTSLFYNCLAVILLLFWHRQGQKDDGWIILSGLFSGFSAFTKLEGAGYIPVHLAVLVTLLWSSNQWRLKDKAMKCGKLLLPAVGMTVFYHAYIYFRIRPDLPPASDPTLGPDLFSLVPQLSIQTFGHIGLVLRRMGEDLFLSGNWNILWLLALGSRFFWDRKQRRQEVFSLTMSLLLFFGIYIVLFSLTQYYYWVAETRDALSRAILQFYPLAVNLFILCWFPVKRSARKPSS